MASFAPTTVRKVPENVPGRFFVADNCIDCDLCRQTAPHIFKRHHVGNSGYSFVHTQPVNDRDAELSLEALRSCPVEAIGTEW